MLIPHKISTSVATTSSQKSTTADKHSPYLDPDFFKPLATEVGLSCNYSVEFYDAFRQSSSSSQHSELAMLVLEYMTLEDKARLPLFEGASDRYVNQVLPAIQDKLVSRNMHQDTLATKIHIMNCASQLGYLTHPSIFLNEAVILNCVSLIGMDLCGAYLVRANLYESDLSNVNLHRAQLTRAFLSKTNLSNANLSEADLRSASLSFANLKLANLSNAKLSEAHLVGADLAGCNLTGTNLSLADLTGADLSGADLSGADLSGADLRGTNLSDANLQGADLTEADLNGPNRLLVEVAKATSKT